MPHVDLTKLTPGEALWLARRRAGRTLGEEAAARGCGRRQLLEAEQGRRAAPRGHGGPVEGPTLPEALRLARRRWGAALGGLATALGVSRVTVHAWERRGDARLVLFWRRQGMRFGALL